MMKITGLSHLFKWENLHNWWLTKYFFAPLYMYRETGQFSSKGIIYYFIGSLNRITVSRLINDSASS